MFGIYQFCTGVEIEAKKINRGRDRPRVQAVQQ